MHLLLGKGFLDKSFWHQREVFNDLDFRFLSLVIIEGELGACVIRFREMMNHGRQLGDHIHAAECILSLLDRHIHLLWRWPMNIECLSLLIR